MGNRLSNKDSTLTVIVLDSLSCSNPELTWGSLYWSQCPGSNAESLTDVCHFAMPTPGWGRVAGSRMLSPWWVLVVQVMVYLAPF